MLAKKGKYSLPNTNHMRRLLGAITLGTYVIISLIFQNNYHDCCRDYKDIALVQFCTHYVYLEF